MWLWLGKINLVQKGNTMNDLEIWGEYDLAESALLILISYYSEIIDEEEGKTLPDVQKIAEWEREKRSLRTLMHGLDVQDQATIANIKATYGPAARAALQGHKP